MSKALWQKQANLSGNVAPKLISINNSEFITVPYSHTKDYCTDCHVQKYNFITNKWSNIIKYPPNLITNSNSVAFNKESQEIYLFGNEYSLIKINLNTQQIKTMKTKQQFGAFPLSIIIDGTYHIIGGTQNNKHFIWNDDIQQFKEIHTFENCSVGFIFASFIYIQRKKLLLLFGGIDGFGTIHDSIWSYSIKEKKWELLDIELYSSLYAFGCILTSDEKYIVLLGGDSGDKMDEIQVMNIDKMEFEDIDIDIVCPFKGQCFATICVDIKNELVISGYIRSYYVDVLPMEIIKLIQLWSKTDFIHLIEFGEWGTHWKIDIDQLGIL